MTESHIQVIGVGVEGPSSLSPSTLDLVNKAEVVFGGQRLLDLFPDLSAEKIVITSDLDRILGAIKTAMDTKKTVVLASGDPNFFGIAQRLVHGLGKDRVEIIPNVSSMQLAFARIKESWEDASFVSVHGRSLEDLVEAFRIHPKVGVFTDHQRTPSTIAQRLIEEGFFEGTIHVCEDLGLPSERLSSGTPSEIVDLEFSNLNVVILRRKEMERGLPFGIPEEFLLHRGTREKGMFTKLEVRAISLAKMQIRDDSVVWDIGAGSGSVAIEAARLASRGKVYAIERNVDDCALIRRNLDRFSIANVQVLVAEAPETLDLLPDPDAVFLGGSGGRLEEILPVVAERLKPGGRLVMNFVALENLSTASQLLRSLGLAEELVQVSISRGARLVNMTKLEPLNPVFVLSTTKAPSEPKRALKDQRENLICKGL